MARTATLIVTPSEMVRREVCDYLKIKPGKVIAVPPAHRIVVLFLCRRLGFSK